MSTENTEVNNQTPVTTPEPTFSKEELENSFQIRLKREREMREATEKQNAEYKARLADLEKKVNANKANQSESQEYYASNKAQGDAAQAQQAGTMTKEQADQYIHHTMNMNNMISQVKDATEKDPEFKDLVASNSTTQKLTDPECAFIAGLPGIKNKAAIIKHLLKDEKDNHIFKINGSNYANDNGASLAKFVYSLNEDLESNLSKPGPSPFRSVPNLQDSGKSDDSDIEEYMNNKY